MATAMNFKFAQFSAIPLESIVPNASPDGLELLGQLLYWNPSKRPTCSGSLRSNYFKVNQKLGPQAINSAVLSKSRSHASLLQRNDWQGTTGTDHVQLTKGQGPATYPYSDTNSMSNSTGTTLHDNNNGLVSDMSSSDNDHNHVTRHTKISSHSINKSGMSAKDQYISRARYVTGQSTKPGSYRNSGKLE